MGNKPIEKKLETFEDSKHSPGPWTYSPQINKEHNCTMAQVWRADGKSLADFDPTPDKEEATANARIAAAAPELLYNLMETHAALCFTSDYLGSYRYEQNKAAIEKALNAKPATP